MPQLTLQFRNNMASKKPLERIKEFNQAAVLLNNFQKHYSSESEQYQLIKLSKKAMLFVLSEKLQDFEEFLDSLGEDTPEPQ
jgi:hypothetical protein